MTQRSKIRPHIPTRMPVTLTLNRKLERALRLAKRALELYNLSLRDAKAQDLRRLELQEALATSFLNGTPITLRAIERNPKKYPPVYDMLNALRVAHRILRHKPFSKKLLCQLHSLIKRQTATHHSKLGTFRDQQNWIGPEGCSQEEAYYIPPSPKKAAVLMRQWIAHCNTQTDEPLLQLSTLVAQFLIIHPFMDGNGRIARLIVPLFLAKRKMLKTPSLFLSPYVQKHRLAYLKALYAITAEGNWVDWTLFFLKGVRSAALTPLK